MRRLAGLTMVLLLAVACGDDGIDGSAIQARMADFVESTESSFPGLGMPVWDDGDEVLLVVIPGEGDPVQLCDAMDDFLVRRDFDDVPIRVVASVLAPHAIASGVSGAGCDKGSPH